MKRENAKFNEIDEVLFSIKYNQMRLRPTIMLVALSKGKKLLLFLFPFVGKHNCTFYHRK